MLGLHRSFRGISEAKRELDFVVSDNDSAHQRAHDVPLCFDRNRRPTLPHLVRIEWWKGSIASAFALSRDSFDGSGCCFPAPLFLHDECSEVKAALVGSGAVFERSGDTAHHGVFLLVSARAPRHRLRPS